MEDARISNETLVHESFVSQCARSEHVFDTKGMRIGITVSFATDNQSIWTCGIIQNVLMLAKLLRQSPQKYDVWLLNTGVATLEKRPGYLDHVQVTKFTELYETCDLIISMGSQIDNTTIAKFKASGAHKKFVVYKCGTDVILRTESILFKENVKHPYQVDKHVDAVFYIPQQDIANKGYYRTLYRTEAYVVPFVWDPVFLDASVAELNKSYYQSENHGGLSKPCKYQPKVKKSVLICEPNLNIVKTCIYPMLIAEEAERTLIGKERLEKVFVSSTLNTLSKNHNFLAFCENLDILPKIRAEARYQIAFVLSQFADVVVSHQFLNPLNYLPLDTARMGYPLLHNMEYLKDLGYYYEGSDTKQAGELLCYILEHHDDNIDEYNRKNSLVLQRYMSTNPQLIASYDVLLQDLFDNAMRHRVYDSMTNLFQSS
jgi:hypothetical protein